MKKEGLTRRIFLGSSLVFCAGAVYWFQNRKKSLHLYANDTQVLLHAAYHLFPQSDYGPGAKDLHIANYLAFVLQDGRILKDDRDLFLKGAFWLEESSFEEYNMSFLNLGNQEKESLLQNVTRQRWGERFVYTSLGYIFEALLCAPVYGSNPKEIGWKWLDHNPGFPQPRSLKEITYEV